MKASVEQSETVDLTNENIPQSVILLEATMEQPTTINSSGQATGKRQSQSSEKDSVKVVDLEEDETRRSVKRRRLRHMRDCAEEQDESQLVERLAHVEQQTGQSSSSSCLSSSGNLEGAILPSSGTGEKAVERPVYLNGDEMKTDHMDVYPVTADREEEEETQQKEKELKVKEEEEKIKAEVKSVEKEEKSSKVKVEVKEEKESEVKDEKSSRAKVEVKEEEESKVKAGVKSVVKIEKWSKAKAEVKEENEFNVKAEAESVVKEEKSSKVKVEEKEEKESEVKDEKSSKAKVELKEEKEFKVKAEVKSEVKHEIQEPGIKRERLSVTQRLNGALAQLDSLDEIVIEDDDQDAIEEEWAATFKKRFKRDLPTRSKDFGNAPVFSLDEDDDNQNKDADIPLHKRQMNPEARLGEEVYMDPSLAGQLMAHQLEGVQFLWKNIVTENEKKRLKNESPKSYIGCLLSHSMGLGKTLQAIAFMYTYLEKFPKSKLLVVVPKNTLYNWAAEVKKWTSKCAKNVPLFPLDGEDKKESLKVLNQWREQGGIAIMGYEKFRNLTVTQAESKWRMDTIKALRKRRAWHDQRVFPGPHDLPDDPHRGPVMDGLRECLWDPGPDVLVLDEGHKIKSVAAATSFALMQVGTRRRIVMTGYPLQNRLWEYYHMVNYTRQNVFRSKGAFHSEFVEPINAGQYIESTPETVTKMYKRLYMLSQRVDPIVHRRGIKTLVDHLTCRKFEYVLHLKRSDVQAELYARFLTAINNNELVMCGFQPVMICNVIGRKIWNHPEVLRRFLRKLGMERLLKNCPEDNDADTDSEVGPCSSSSSSLPSCSSTPSSSSASKRKKPSAKAKGKGKATKKKKNTRDEEEDGIEDEEHDDEEGDDPDEDPEAPEIEVADPTRRNFVRMRVRGGEMADGETGADPKSSVRVPKEVAVDYSFVKDAYIPILLSPDKNTYDPDVVKCGSKLVILFEMLQECWKFGDKALVFSNCLTTLDILEVILQHTPVPKEANECFIEGIHYYRMDGQTPSKLRNKMSVAFNKPTSPLKVFLVSTPCGLGINLIGANRVFMLDANWNPCIDIQAIFRVYRIGQKRDVYIYRLVIGGTIEAKVYQQEVLKEGLFQRAVDKRTAKRHYTREKLGAYYDVQEEDAILEHDWTHATIADDFVLQTVVAKYGRNVISAKEELIIGIHQHESLLEEEQDGILTASEKRQAHAEMEKVEEEEIRISKQNSRRRMIIDGDEDDLDDEEDDGIHTEENGFAFRGGGRRSKKKEKHK